MFLRPGPVWGTLWTNMTKVGTLCEEIDKLGTLSVTKCWALCDWSSHRARVLRAHTDPWLDEKILSRRNRRAHLVTAGPSSTLEYHWSRGSELNINVMTSTHPRGVSRWLTFLWGARGPKAQKVSSSLEGPLAGAPVGLKIVSKNNRNGRCWSPF